MGITDVRKTTLGIINEVERKLGLSASSSLTSNGFTTMLLDLLNDVIDETADYADWQEMFREVTVTAASSVGTYEVAVSSQVKNIYEVVWDDDISPLEVRTIEDMRRLQRIGSFGVPRQFAIVGVSGVNPKIRVYPVPASAAIANATTPAFDIAYYKKPSLLTTSDASTTPAFPSRVLVQGLYAKAILEENGGESTPDYRTAYAEYTQMRKEASNRLTTDTGTDVYFTPTGAR